MSRYRLVAACFLGLAYFAVAADGTPAAQAEESKGEGDGDPEAKVNFVELAARLVHDKHFDRALSVLSEADPSSPDIEASRFYTLRGLANLNLQRFDAAQKDFAAAVASGQRDPLIRLYEAQAYWGLGDPKGTLTALSLAKEAGQNEPGVWLMKAEAQRKLGLKPAAVSTLQAGSKKFPSVAAFDRAQLFYLIELGLYVEATDVGERYLRRSDVSAEDYVAVGEALRAAGQFQRAQVVLEGASLRYPDSEQVLLQLAHSYLDGRRALSAAMLFEKASRTNPKYTLESAELYRQSRMIFRAMSLNARVADQAAKTKQRLSLMVDLGSFEAVTAMLPKVTRLGLLADENIKYAMAYAFFKTGRFSEASAQLKSISQPELYESSLQLRKAMDACAETGWECSP